MGWQKIGDLTIGDEPLDLMAECVERIARCYQEEMGRDPTAGEVLEYVRHALDTQGKIDVPDLAELQITGISLKTKKLPKTQRFNVGDVFAIPLGKEYRYGRILKETSAGRLVEIYDTRSDSLLSFPQLARKDKSPHWQKHVNGLKAFRNRRWLIIGHQDVPADYDYARFYTGSPFIGFVIRRGDEEEHVEELHAAMSVEPLIMFSPETIEDRISTDAPDPWPEVEQVLVRDLE